VCVSTSSSLYTEQNRCDAQKSILFFLSFTHHNNFQPPYHTMIHTYEPFVRSKPYKLDINGGIIYSWSCFKEERAIAVVMLENGEQVADIAKHLTLPTTMIQSLRDGLRQTERQRQARIEKKEEERGKYAALERMTNRLVEAQVRVAHKAADTLADVHGRSLDSFDGMLKCIVRAHLNISCCVFLVSSDIVNLGISADLSGVPTTHTHTVGSSELPVVIDDSPPAKRRCINTPPRTPLYAPSPAPAARKSFLQMTEERRVRYAKIS
jgi:hypothetical protein